MKRDERTIRDEQMRKLRAWEQRTEPERAARRQHYRDRERIRVWIGVRETRTQP